MRTLCGGGETGTQFGGGETMTFASNHTNDADPVPATEPDYFDEARGNLAMGLTQEAHVQAVLALVQTLRDLPAPPECRAVPVGTDVGGSHAALCAELATHRQALMVAEAAMSRAADIECMKALVLVRQVLGLEVGS